MSQTALDRFAGELVASFTPQLADDRDAREHVVSELRADTHGGTRKEWADVKGSLDGSALAPAHVRRADYLQTRSDSQHKGAILSC
jgi:hypothetical protein